MIRLKTGVPAYREPNWPHSTESWLFCEDPSELDELLELGETLGYTDWRASHCPPHWRITDAEANLLCITQVDSLTMTIHCRTWRRHLNSTVTLPKPKSHKKGEGKSGRPAGA